MSLHSTLILLLTTLCITATSAIHAQNIDILFTGIKSGKGQIIVKVFTDEKTFQDNKALKVVRFRKTDMIKDQLSGKLNLEPGTYGLALHDDENGSGIMEYNFLGMPKEGFGFSNFYLSGMKKPKFEQFKFTVSKNQQLKINMKLRYL